MGSENVIGLAHSRSVFRLASEKMLGLALVDLGMDYKVKSEEQCPATPVSPKKSTDEWPPWTPVV